jgi:hypothetical protein
VRQKSSCTEHLALRQPIAELAMRDYISPLDAKKTLVPAPTGISPALTAQQKHNKKNYLRVSIWILPSQRNLVDSFAK